MVIWVRSALIRPPASSPHLFLPALSPHIRSYLSGGIRLVALPLERLTDVGGMEFQRCGILAVWNFSGKVIGTPTGQQNPQACRKCGHPTSLGNTYSRQTTANSEGNP